MPDHSSLTRIRERYGVEVFRRFFDTIVEQCQQEKLVWDRELYIDSTQVNANADLASLTPRFAVEARAAIQAHLAALSTEEDSQAEPQSAAAEGASAPTPEAAATEAVLYTEPIALPTAHCEAEQEELASEHAALHDWIAEEGWQHRECMASTSARRTSKSAPPILTRRLCGSKEEARIWGIIRTMSSMAAKRASSSRCW